MTARVRIGLAILLGFGLGVFPEAAIAGLAMIGLVGLVKGNVVVNRWAWAFVAFGVVRGFLHWRVQNAPWVGFFEAAFCYLLWGGASCLQPLTQAGFKRGLLLGGFGTASVVLLSLLPGFVKPTAWILNGDKRIQATLQQNQSGDQLAPVSLDNAYIFRGFGQQGSGHVRLTLEMRSAQPVKLRVALLHKDLPAGPVGKSVVCNVDRTWGTCLIDVNLLTRADLTLLIGGYNTWKAENGILDIRRSQLEVLVFPTLEEWLWTLPRVQGWTFNANAFAAWMTLIVLVTVMSSRLLWEWCLLVPIFLAVLLSGSRGAVGVSVIGIFCGLWLILPSKYKISLYVIVSLLVFGFILFNSLDTPLRALRVLTEDGSNTSRLEIYQLSLRAFLESPFIGVGNLMQFMQSYATSPNLVWTHAHNLFLQILGESGLLGLLAFTGLWMSGLRSRFKDRDVAGLMFLTCVFLLNQSDYLYWYAPMQALLWIGFSGFDKARVNSTTPISSNSRIF